MSNGMGNDVGSKSIIMIQSGKIRNHKLTNNARKHTGTIEEQELSSFRRFLPSKNGCMVRTLEGKSVI